MEVYVLGSPELKMPVCYLIYALALEKNFTINFHKICNIVSGFVSGADFQIKLYLTKFYVESKVVLFNY